MRVEAKEVDLEQKTRGNILLSTSKFAKEGYVLVYDKEEVIIYEATTTEIENNFKSILKGNLRKNIGVWHIQLKYLLENETTNTLVVNRHDFLHAILNMYQLPSTEKVVRYLHVAEGLRKSRHGLNLYERVILSHGQV